MVLLLLSCEHVLLMHVLLLMHKVLLLVQVSLLRS
jgi:hypothetical protein